VRDSRNIWRHKEKRLLIGKTFTKTKIINRKMELRRSYCNIKNIGYMAKLDRIAKKLLRICNIKNIGF